MKFYDWCFLAAGILTLVGGWIWYRAETKPFLDWWQVERAERDAVLLVAIGCGLAVLAMCGRG